MPLPAAIGSVSKTMLGGLTLLLLALAAFAMIDVPLQRFQHAQRLKMSHQDQKQEHKELEGNQEIKAKIRSRMREMTKRRMMAAVPTADLIVMNPTHYAVALKYEAGGEGAPQCVAKGMDAIALRIRKVAEDNGVPVIVDPPLARSLYASVEIEEFIPQKHYEAVAKIIGFIMQSEKKAEAPKAKPKMTPTRVRVPG